MQKFKVTPEGEPEYSVTATSRDIAKWERTNKGVSFGQLQQDMRMSDLYKIAWIASQRQGLFDGPLKAFEDGVDLVPDDDQDDDEAEDPTPSAA